MNFTELDIVIIVVLVIAFLVGLVMGAVRQLLLLISLAVAGWVATAFFAPFSAYLQKFIVSDPLRQTIAFIFLFIVAFILLSVLSHFLNKLLRGSGAMIADRFLGAGLGLVIGILVIANLATLASITDLKKEIWWKHSVLLPLIQPVSDGVLDLLPKDVANKFRSDANGVTLPTPKQ